MSVLVRIPTILRSYTGGAAEVTAAEGTLREVIAGLDAAYPGLGGRILDDGGKIDPRYRTAGGADTGFRLWNLDRRRQAAATSSAGKPGSDKKPAP